MSAGLVLEVGVRNGQTQGVPTYSVSGSFYESILTMTVNQPWTRDALCRQTDPDAFFPEDGSRPSEAKTICGLCDVRSECLKYSLTFSYRDDVGFWGGTSEVDRRVLRAALKRGLSFDYANPDINGLRSMLSDEELRAVGD